MECKDGVTTVAVRTLPKLFSKQRKEINNNDETHYARIDSRPVLFYH